MSTAEKLTREREGSTGRPRLVRREHVDFGELGIPYYDEELDVAAGKPHSRVIVDFGGALGQVARLAGLEWLSDNPIWYLEPGTDKQKTFYGDLALSHHFEGRDMATDIALVIEVVTTGHTEKLEKDTVFQKRLNEYNGVPEFVLYFPDLEDQRDLIWYRLEDGRYQELVPEDRRYISQSVPGLEVRTLPRYAWLPGRKVTVSYKGEPILYPDEEKQRADREHERADRERERADRERERADREYQRRLELERRLAELEGKHTGPGETEGD